MAEPREPRPDRPVFRARHRLSRATDFRQAYCHGARRSAGPITIYLRPNGLREHRLGLSVGRRVGGAVVRNRVKRLLREAFRLSRAELPSEGEGCDIVISVRPHRPLPLAAYRRLLTDVVARARRDLPPSGPAQERADAPG